MTILDQNTNNLTDMPRFSDGSINLQELIRVMAETLINAIMDAQADEACEQGNQRNGLSRARIDDLRRKTKSVHSKT